MEMTTKLTGCCCSGASWPSGKAAAPSGWQVGLVEGAQEWGPDELWGDVTVVVHGARREPKGPASGFQACVGKSLSAIYAEECLNRPF